ncbi:MAG: TIGR02594 family protein [Hyphomicrobiaceae bacterium]|nr:TIGR02594 family protein [Hyphomicrobiaceae bacterium]
MEQPAWLDHAWREAGVRETPGPAGNDRILQFFRDVGHPAVASDEVAWCAAFLGACLERAGLRSTRSLLARSYLDWGTPLQTPKLGAVATLSRGSDPGQGHVGFVIGAGDGRLFLLGGNQQDAVSVQSFETSRLLGLRWPPVAAPQDGSREDIFETSLAHVLEMEGGWSDDPHDPGGPTNLGITLAVYAASKGVELTEASRAALKRELQRLEPAAARQIYRTRYWTPSRADALPPGLALMHFDAAVNHGVGNAARMLQQALRVTADGEIGPETLGASRTLPSNEIVGRYADIRRERYRSRGHFWRFGRGWLRRVERTVAAAQKIKGVQTSPSMQRQPGERNMTATDNPSGTGKWWGNSVTIWGALVTAASTVLPVIGPLLGLEITPDLVSELGDRVVDVAQALGGLVGIAMTIYGRTRATTTLERRQITFQL